MFRRPYAVYRPSLSTKLTKWNYFLKRIFDFLGAGILLIFCFPLFIVIVPLITLDSPGRIFFKQTRIGLKGEKFVIWKFRTMKQNAEKLQSELEAKNEIVGGVLFKIKQDPRITRVGKYLRKYSLDEIPQLFNVLLGQMSLVGPRPLPVRDVEKMPSRYHVRHNVIPGITGLGQISGRSNCSSEEYLELDIYYIKNWSLRLDLKILLKTIPSILLKIGAF